MRVATSQYNKTIVSGRKNLIDNTNAYYCYSSTKSSMAPIPHQSVHFLQWSQHQAERAYQLVSAAATIQ
jgi:hypothetical protein